MLPDYNPPDFVSVSGSVAGLLNPPYLFLFLVLLPDYNPPDLFLFLVLLPDYNPPDFVSVSGSVANFTYIEHACCC